MLSSCLLPIRDIPMPLVSSGVEHGNLRELALARMKDMGTEVRLVLDTQRTSVSLFCARRLKPISHRERSKPLKSIITTPADYSYRHSAFVC